MINRHILLKGYNSFSVDSYSTQISWSMLNLHSTGDFFPFKKDMPTHSWFILVFSPKLSRRFFIIINYDMSYLSIPYLEDMTFNTKMYIRDTPCTLTQAQPVHRPAPTLTQIWLPLPSSPYGPWPSHDPMLSTHLGTLLPCRLCVIEDSWWLMTLP